MQRRPLLAVTLAATLFMSLSFAFPARADRGLDARTDFFHGRWQRSGAPEILEEPGVLPGAINEDPSWEVYDPLTTLGLCGAGNLEISEKFFGTSLIVLATPQLQSKPSAKIRVDFGFRESSGKASSGYLSLPMDGSSRPDLVFETSARTGGSGMYRRQTRRTAVHPQSDERLVIQVNRVERREDPREPNAAPVVIRGVRCTFLRQH